jgi:multidrug efflux pump subunit AcrB
VNVNGLKNMTSFSREQFSGVMLEFDVGVNMDAKMNLVRENLDQVRDLLPKNTSAPVITLFDFNSDPIMRIAYGAVTTTVVKVASAKAEAKTNSAPWQRVLSKTGLNKLTGSPPAALKAGKMP